MSIRFTVPPTTGVYLVRRPLTDTELDTVRQALHADIADPRELVDTVVAAVFTALLAGTGDTYADRCCNAAFERGLYAVPISQWTGICLAVTGRVAGWDASTIAVEMAFAALMPSAYDDPTVATPKLAEPDRTDTVQLEITAGAAATITRCQQHLAALADTYGGMHPSVLAAAGSWLWQLHRLLTESAGPRTVHADGPLSLTVCTAAGTYWIAFEAAPNRCTAAGCQAEAITTPDQSVLWQPPFAGAVMADHEHELDHPVGAPHPGTWSALPATGFAR